MAVSVRLIRHAESAANAGGATSDPALIPLSALGERQAINLAQELDAPELIIVSPFTRAQQTAAPTIARFPGVPVETWDIHEFTYLAPARCVGMTAGERRPLVEEYWLRSDPEHVDGEGAESFNSMLRRAGTALNRMAEVSGPVYVFGHGQVMQAMRWLVLRGIGLVDGETMRDFRAFDSDVQNHIANCSSIDLKHTSTGWKLARS